MDGKFTITLTLQKEDHSLQIHSDDSPGLMWSIAAIRQGLYKDRSWIRAAAVLSEISDSICIKLVCSLATHQVELFSENCPYDWADAIFQQALEHLNNEQRFLFAIIKQKEMQVQSGFQGMITDIRRQ